MRAVRLIKVLASFPSDVSEEASSLDAVTAELNRSIGDVHGVRFEVFNWLRDVRPDAGADLQSVVNSQIGNDYDVIVATFWSRAGTPTPRAESGSIEEVKSALARAKRCGGRPAIMVYMKSGGINPLKVDVKQLSVLAEFRWWLSENGVLFKEFSDQVSFEAYLRLDLAKVAADSGLSSDSIAGGSEKLSGQTGYSEEEELGLLDYLDIQESALGRMSEVLEGQIFSVNRLADSLSRDAEAINNLTSTGPADRAAAKRLLLRTSETWNQFSDESGRRLVDLRKSTEEAFEAIAKRLSLSRADGNPPDLKSVEQLEALVDAISAASLNTQGFRGSISKMPRLISELNRAKRRVLEVLDDWISQFEHIIAFARDIVDSEGR